MLLTTSCKHVRYHLAHRDELRLCADILGEILGYLFKQRSINQELGKVNNCIHHDVDTLTVNILDMLTQTVLFIIDKNVPVLVCLINNFNN